MSPTNINSITQTWQELCRRYADKPGLLEIYILQTIQITAFWIPATTLLLLDICFPRWSNRHKIQSERFQPTSAQIRHCITHVLINNTTSAVLVLLVGWATSFQRPMFTVSSSLPSWSRYTTDLIYAAFSREILFYTTHRLFHHPRLYKRFHKQHHLFVAPMSFAAQYAHPVEHILANVLPIMLPLAAKKAHLLTFATYLAWSLVETCCAHSGYDFFTFPVLGTMHDLHHEKFNVNFGGMAWLDWFCGTVRWSRVPSSSSSQLLKPGLQSDNDQLVCKKSVLNGITGSKYTVKEVVIIQDVQNKKKTL